MATLAVCAVLLLPSAATVSAQSTDEAPMMEDHAQTPAGETQMAMPDMQSMPMADSSLSMDPEPAMMSEPGMMAEPEATP
jgi:hypothetical protein